MKDKPAREWWINTFSKVIFKETPGLALQMDPEIIRVVEFAAYDKLAKQLALEQARGEKLVEALRKIADPRLRDHREPDKYTEVGCMMNMAEEAIAAYEAKGE